jgi:hypothetical protein
MVFVRAPVDSRGYYPPPLRMSLRSALSPFLGRVAPIATRSGCTYTRVRNLCTASLTLSSRGLDS